MTLRHASGGFTLIELMVVVIIVAVLLMVALPAYQNQIIRGHRAAAKAEMLEIGNRQEQYLLSNRTYTNAFTTTTIADFAYQLPPDVATKYEIIDLSTTTAIGSTLPAYSLTFGAIGTQEPDGDLTLNSVGEKEPADKWKR
jgi:type IV pilus assembly protein PilE